MLALLPAVILVLIHENVPWGVSRSIGYAPLQVGSVFNRLQFFFYSLNVKAGLPV